MGFGMVGPWARGGQGFTRSHLNLPTLASRPCTCHPEERPPVCPHKYAFSECKAAYEANCARIKRGDE